MKERINCEGNDETDKTRKRNGTNLIVLESNKVEMQSDETIGAMK
jgi:hypothetical protein